MTIRVGKFTFIASKWPDALPFHVGSNIGPGDVNRRDRAAIKVAYVAIYFRRYLVEVMRQLKGF